MSASHTLLSLCARLRAQSHSSAKPSVPARRYGHCAVEQLEDRQLLSVTASISGNPDVNEGAMYGVLLSASSSNGQLGNWSINWGDGTAPVSVSPTSGAAFHVYNDGEDNHTVTATIAEYGSYSDNDVQTRYQSVAVHDVAPTATFTATDDRAFGEDMYLTLDGVTDPGQDTITQWTINWGDGKPPVTYAVSGQPWQQFHYDGYDVEGNYTATIAATDEDGTHYNVASIGTKVEKKKFVPSRTQVEVTKPANANQEVASDVINVETQDEKGRHVKDVNFEVVVKGPNGQVTTHVRVQIVQTQTERRFQLFVDGAAAVGEYTVTIKKLGSLGGTVDPATVKLIVN